MQYIEPPPRGVNPHFRRHFYTYPTYLGFLIPRVNFRTKNIKVNINIIKSTRTPSPLYYKKRRLLK
nr:MAG TPA: hypothetical protein [Herelleviridae sp.]